MRKVISIGESVLDTVFDVSGRPVKAMVGGRVSCASASLGELGFPVSMVSECCRDSVGDLVLEYLDRHNVDTSSVDRYTDGATALAAIFRGDDGTERIVNYGVYPKENRFDVVWPRIDEDDIVLFGSLYAIDAPQRERLFELVSHAVERKAIIIYLPGFQHGINFRITRVMPAILENLEVSDLVIAHSRDIDNIFPGEKGEEAFKEHIEFYCPNYLHIHRDLGVDLYTREHGRCGVKAPSLPSSNLLGWQSGLVAGVINELLRRDVTRESLRQLPVDEWRAILSSAVTLAEQCAASEENCLTD